MLLLILLCIISSIILVYIDLGKKVRFLAWKLNLSCLSLNLNNWLNGLIVILIVLLFFLFVIVFLENADDVIVVLGTLSCCHNFVSTLEIEKILVSHDSLKSVCNGDDSKLLSILRN
jgi:hypothetical protein